MGNQEELMSREPPLFKQRETLESVPLVPNTVGQGYLAAPPVQSEASNILAIIERASRDPAVDVEKLDRLLQMSERVQARNAEQTFNEAMTAAQEGMRAVRADADNPQTRSKYASYPALDRAMRPIYTKHGFALSFDTGESPENMVKVLCYVSHRAGHSRTYHVDMPADGKGAKGGDVMTRTHATGSALTYGTRYLLKLIFNIAVGDDDGNGASETGGTISQEEADRIVEFLNKWGGDPEAFCKIFKVEALIELPVKRKDEAWRRLNEWSIEKQKTKK